MKISSININNSTPNSMNKKVTFRNSNEGQSNINKKNDDNKYVKVPKRQHVIEKWVVGILGILTAFEVMDFVFNKKWKSWKI